MEKTKPCSKCLKYKDRNTEFYMASSELISSDGRMPICKSCFRGIIDEKDKTTLINALRSVDRPFIEKVYQDSYNQDGGHCSTGGYMRIIGMPHNRNKNYSNSEFLVEDQEKHLVDESLAFKDPSEDTETKLRNLGRFEKRWGVGFEEEDYIFLENEYNKLMDSHEEEIVDSRSAEILIEEAIHLKLSIQKKRIQGNGSITGQDVKNMKDLLKAAGISPENKKDNTNEEVETFGKFIEQWENERPIPEPASEWRDVDNIKTFFNVYVLGHLKRMMGIKNKDEETYWEELNKHTPDILLEQKEEDTKEDDKDED